ncbi:response regulator [Rheinheimera salexigens]|uniref:DNA-binding protein n=1 Tax=Rheinheimera salexigens TaxID=1628148 RepID=A0A1E7Q8L8_9GAMM|nr:response regulator [Rheinheimera salexigens]OEY70529.1 DNA-binding protein [Rheinheimera salexigens]
MQQAKILLVDDIDYTRQLLRNNIMSLAKSKTVAVDNFQFFNANSALSAMNIFSLQSPDIIFLDIELPDGSGLDLLAKIKRVKPDCFIVMVSANSTLENVQSSIKSGAATFIVKPFTGDKIMAAMRLYAKHRLKN